MRWIVLACVLTAGCATQTETASDNFGPAQAAEFRCPKAGTRVTFSTGSVTRYTGTDPDNHSLCKGVFGNRTAFRLLYNYWDTKHIIPEEVAPDMTKLFPTTKGKSVQFVHHGSPIGSANLSQRYIERWRILGGEDVALGSQSVHTVVFEREAAGTDGSNTSLMRYRLWFAPDLGVWVRSDATSVRGTTVPQSFLVADVVVP